MTTEISEAEQGVTFESLFGMLTLPTLPILFSVKAVCSCGASIWKCAKRPEEEAKSRSAVHEWAREHRVKCARMRSIKITEW